MTRHNQRNRHLSLKGDSLKTITMNPPYVMAWLNPQVSAQDMMDPELFKRLVLNNFCELLLPS